MIRLIGWLSAAVLSALLSLGLFYLMYKMIESNENSIVDTTAYKIVEFIQLKKQEREPQRRKVLPPEPKAKKEPPRVKKSLNTTPSKNVQVAPKSINMALAPIQTNNVSAGAMPNIGLPAPSNADSELSAMVQINPMYPPRAKRMGIEGYVKVLISVDEEGEVEDIKVVESEPDGVFDKSVIRAIRRWQFKPKILNGVAIKQEGEMRLNFTLDK